MGIPIIDSILGIGSKLVDRLVPDVNKAQDQAHETANKQADITAEGERAKNYFTPRAVLMYVLVFAIAYGLVIQPFATAFGVPLPVVDITPALKMLVGMLGLGG